MKHKLISLLIICLYSTCSFGQDSFKDFKIQQSQVKISNSLYNKISFIDSRIDTTSLGIVQVGLMNIQAKVVSSIPIALQLNNFLNSVIDSSSQDGTLLFQIRQILFSEMTSMSSEKGYFYIRANLFSQKENNYLKLASIDTLIVVNAFDVTNQLLKAGSDLITNCISSNLLKNPTENELYTYNDILRVDSIEKRKIKIYNINGFTDGVYYSYKSFKDQNPDDKEILVKRKKDLSISKVMIKDNNNLIELKSNDLYAFVTEGQPYISTGYGYYPLYFSNDNFYFVGNVKPITPNNSDMVAVGAMFGLIGAIIIYNSEGYGENYFTIIDHITGEFIKIKKM